MCGICGVVGGDREREAGQVRAMAAALSHRGPDDEGFHVDDGAVLGHRRLTIIDLGSGRQPLSNEDGTLWITFNGEIYNYKELRTELEGRGHRFRTQTDTEVIVHLYEERGRDCLEPLRGMFAFALWDSRRRTLFAARDRFGQKPFFYAERAGRLLFASEIKGLLAHAEVGAQPDLVAIDHYLGLRFVPPPLTMLRDVSKLAAGHWLEWCDGRLRTGCWWAPEFREGPHRTDADWLGELETRLDEAVHSHMVSDVPVGAFLSGGLDSSLVATFMSRHAPEPVQTFCVGSDGGGFDEREHARRVAAQCGSLHRETCATGVLLDTLPWLVRCLDEPSDPIAACMHEVAALASRHVKVVLGGDGGDELFGGFDRYAAYDWVGWYAALPRWLREGVVRPALRRLPESFAYKSLSQRARWLDAMGSEAGGRRYARMTTFFRFGSEDKDWLYGPGLRSSLQGHDVLEAIVKPFESAATGTVLHRMLYADMLTRLPEHTLMLTDRMGMAHGLETRCPLLDHRLAEFCAAMPSRLKVHRGSTKVAVRRVAEKLLPPGIARRPKQGFMFPVAEWLNDRTLESIGERLRRGPLVEERWIEPVGIDRLLGEHRRRRVDHHVRIWMLLNLDAWHRIYLGGEQVVRHAGPDPVARAQVS